MPLHRHVNVVMTKWVMAWLSKSAIREWGCVGKWEEFLFFYFFLLFLSCLDVALFFGHLSFFFTHFEYPHKPKQAHLVRMSFSQTNGGPWNLLLSLYTCVCIYLCV